MKKVIFLHHSTGWNVWLGGTHRYLYKLTGKSALRSAVNSYAGKQKLNLSVTERFFPKASPYGWNNYPYDYYNIWVKHAGNEPYMEEPTLEILTREYDLIIFKHCYPVSNILPDTGTPDIDSAVRTLENYKLQYNALKRKMHQFPGNKFIVWTPAANVRSRMSAEEAQRTREFHDWIINEWDEKGDNIFVWDFYMYETEGGLFLPEKNAEGPDNSHPNREFSARAARSLGRFVVDVIVKEVE
ncbi:MAG: hypothetical protein GT598_09755 [Bacteroidales bacterium]|nr:hypothetical protein [Bacteroidales bacterium]